MQCVHLSWPGDGFFKMAAGGRGNQGELSMLDSLISFEQLCE